MRKTLAFLVPLMGAVGCGKRPAPADNLVPATLSNEPSIPYPPDLFTRRIEGDVLLYLVVDSTGSAVRDSTRVAKSSGQAAFDAAALTAATSLHFTPAQRNGVPVAAPIQVPIKFRLPDSLKNARDHQ